MMNQKTSMVAIFLLLFFLTTLFISISKSSLHSLTSVEDPLHFHVYEHESNHHENTDKSHTDEDRKTMFKFDQFFNKNNFQLLDLSLITFIFPYSKQPYLELKHYMGKLSGADPPNGKLDFSLFYPNAPPFLA